MNLRIIFTWLAAVILGLSIYTLPTKAVAGSATFTSSPSVDATLAADIPSPSGVQQNSFTGSSGDWLYSLYHFTVDQSGAYTVVSTTPGLINAIWVVRGVFVPNLTVLNTPASDFIAGILTEDAPYTGTLTVNLTAGQQYAILIAHDWDAESGVYTNTTVVNGPGDITEGVVPAPIPTLSEWAMILLSVGLAGGAVVIIQRRKGLA